ncbi:uncharacterized protein LOC112599223 [Melanaphis sacchari]|uniref:uncharacterized protein LOC112599223 n=1 Tax=Melanaphis sacchari TaxID=742174 RepID=UPI000DC13B91|nr:uncharacterized protein LOC112599223 [Melanaphis sacchari]
MNGASKLFRPSSRIERPAKPLARLRKPLIRVNAVYLHVDYQITWCNKGLDPPDTKIQVILCPSPQRATTETGISCAALKYEASENIKLLAKPRPIPKTDDKKCFSVKPLSLTYKSSLRYLQLSKS